MGWDCEHQSIWESECGEWYCLIALTHRFCTHSFEKGVSADVSGQADIRDGVCGDEEVDAVGVWVERRIQLFAERLVHGLRPCCLAHIKLHTGKCILSQDLLDCPTPDPMSITSATINQYFAILLKHQYVSPAIKLHLATWNSRYDSFRVDRTKNSTRFIIDPILLSSFSSYRKTNQSQQTGVISISEYSNFKHHLACIIIIRPEMDAFHMHNTSLLGGLVDPELTNGTLKDYEPWWC